MKSLEGIAERQRNPPGLPDRIISAISPFAAFGPTNEEQLKQLFMTTATRISNVINLLLEDSFQLDYNLNVIHETLKRIAQLAKVDDSGNISTLDGLSYLWARLARPDDYEKYKSHSSLLKDMTRFYESSSHVVHESIAELQNIDAQLMLSRKDYDDPALLLSDEPLEVIIAKVRKSAKKLEAGKKRLERVAGGERPQRDTIRKPIVTATVLVRP